MPIHNTEFYTMKFYTINNKNKKINKSNIQNNRNLKQNEKWPQKN